jgi:uracil-DNA glycosylase
VYFTAVTRCYPGKSRHGKGDRVPSAAEQTLCAPYLEEELALVRPRVILLLGRLASQRFLGGTPGTWQLGEPVEIEGVVSLLCLPHPSGVNRWHNHPAHQAQAIRALQHLSAWREQYSL